MRENNKKLEIYFCLKSCKFPTSLEVAALKTKNSSDSATGTPILRYQINNILISDLNSSICYFTARSAFISLPQRVVLTHECFVMHSKSSHCFL